jgi:hypothetical protein
MVHLLREFKLPIFSWVTPIKSLQNYILLIKWLKINKYSV